MMTPQGESHGQEPISGAGRTVVTRFAPSPTGPLHLGHAFSAILAHDFARERGGRFLLRVEDIDGTRSRPEHVAGILADLEWLGLAWDGDVVLQSQRLDLYAEALARLKAMGLLYPCFCTRKDIAASASAPHGPEGLVYPGTCRGLPAAVRDQRMAAEPHAWRLDMAAALSEGRGPERAAAREDLGGLGPGLRRGALEWSDHGRAIPADPGPFGDVVLARKDAPVSYHLAVTVDDAAQGVTDVVRGEDLFAATHVHRLLQALLGLPTPAYHHHALIAGPDGARLAKRHGAVGLAQLRAQGADPAAIVAALREGRLPAGNFAAEA